MLESSREKSSSGWLFPPEPRGATVSQLARWRDGRVTRPADLAYAQDAL